MGKQKRYTDEQFIEAIQTSMSMRKALDKLGLRPTGGNYAVAKNRIKSLGIDDSHFKRQGWNKGMTFVSKVSLESLLVEDSIYQSFKQRLLKEKIFTRKCNRCGLETWLEEPIPLELEHKNGVSTDNRIENLELLCPNCHALTPTYRGKNIKK
jgi:hypothetical protein